MKKKCKRCGKETESFNINAYTGIPGGMDMDISTGI